MKLCAPRILSALTLFLWAFALSSCLKYEQRTQVNADQSGKAMIELEVASPLVLLAAKMKPKELAEEMAKGILGAANGVEAWSDVEYGFTPTGKLKFSGVAYFPDLKEFATGSSGGGTDKMPQLGEWKSEMVDGKWVIQMDLKMDALGGKKGDPVPADQIEAKIEAQRAEWKTLKGTVGLFVSEVEMDFSLQVAGKVESVQNLKMTKDDTVSIILSGREILDGLETLLMDDDYVRTAMEEGNVDSKGRAIPEGADIAEILLGGEGPAKVVINPGEPLFDYETEVAEARAAMSDELKALIKEGRILMRKTGES